MSLLALCIFCQATIFLSPVQERQRKYMQLSGPDKATLTLVSQYSGKGTKLLWHLGGQCNINSLLAVKPVHKKKACFWPATHLLCVYVLCP